MDKNAFSRRIIAYLVIILFFIADRYLKFYSSKNPEDYLMKWKYAGIKFTKNYFIAFSLPIPEGPLIIFVVGAIVVFLIFLSFKYLRAGNYLGEMACLLISVGSVSNLYDRIMFGYVIDYVDIKYFTVLNLADLMIVSGAIILAAVIYRPRAIKG